MIKVKVGQFCSLATSPSWQTWLYHNHTELYRKFVRQLQESKGCNQNRSIMAEVLQEIDKVDSDGLIDFLQKHYPHVLDGQPVPSQQREDAEALEHDGVFSHYNPSILTYPRRQIFVGPPGILRRKAKTFLADKLKSDFIVIGERLYIEYLDQGDSEIADQIPMKNWMISQYRLRSQS
jgi:hypothetical protein